MIKTVDQAHAALADALWWLKGFAAASEGHSEARAMADDLREARNYLDRIAEGQVRRIGDEKAIVLTYAEFEALYDFVSHLDATEGEKERAVTTVRDVLAQYQREADIARTLPEIPF